VRDHSSPGGSRYSPRQVQDGQAVGLWEEAWVRLVEQYSTEFAAVMAGVPRPSAGTASVPFDPEGLWELLVRLSRLEEEANVRLAHSGVLAGISREDLQAAASAGTRPGAVLRGHAASPLLAEHCWSVLQGAGGEGNASPCPVCVLERALRGLRPGLVRPGHG